MLPLSSRYSWTSQPAQASVQALCGTPWVHPWTLCLQVKATCQAQSLLQFELACQAQQACHAQEVAPSWTKRTGEGVRLRVLSVVQCRIEIQKGEAARHSPL